jgi:hypothetical protein
MIKPMKFQVLTISQIPSPAELRHDIERELLQNFSAKESGYRNEIHRLTVECKDRETLIQQHDKNMDAAKVRCEEARNLAQVVQSKLEVTRKEKMETEARLEALQGTAQSETYDAAEIDGLKKCLQENADELHKKTEELAKLEHARTDLEARNTNLQIAWEQQTAEIAQDSSVIDRLRQETDAELRKEQDKSNATIDLAQIQTRILEKAKGDLQAKLEQAQLLESELKRTYAALVAERDGLRSRATELEAAKANTVSKYEERLETLRREHENSGAALKEAEARIQLQKTEHHKKIEFDRQKYESIVQVLTDELNKTKFQAASRADDQQQALRPTTSKLPLPSSLPNKQVGKTRKKVSRENNSVLDVAELSGTLISTSAQGVPAFSSRRHRQDLDQSDNLFDEEHDSLGKDVMGRYQGCSVVDPAAEQVEDTQDVTGAAIPCGHTADQVCQERLRGTQYDDQVLLEDSSLSSPFDSDDLSQLLGDAQAIQMPMGAKHSPTQRSSQEHVPETPIRSKKSSLSGSQSSHSHGRPGSQANTASRLMPAPESSHLGQHKPSPTRQGMSTSRQHTSDQTKRGVGPSYGSSSGFESQHSSATKGNYVHRPWTRDVWGPPRPSQSQKRKQKSDQDAPSKRKRTPSHTTSQSPSPSSQSSSPHQLKSSGPSAAVSRTRPQIPSSFPSVSPTDHSTRPQLASSDAARRSYNRAPSSNSTSRLGIQQSSVSRPSVSTHSPHVYGRHQTRSKSKLLQRLSKYARLTMLSHSARTRTFRKRNPRALSMDVTDALILIAWVESTLVLVVFAAITCDKTLRRRLLALCGDLSC